MPNVTSLVQYMIVLREEQRTGVLAVRSGDTQTSLHVREGALVFAEEDAHGETLGRMLVRQNTLTQAQYNDVIAKMSDALVIHEQLRFGELAVELRFLTHAQVSKALADQVRGKVMRVLQRRDDVTWEFSPGAPTAPAVSSFSVTLEELVLDAVRWIDDDQKNDLGLFEILGQKLGVRPEDRAAVAKRFALARDEEEFLQRLDGKRALGEVLAASGSVDAPALLTAFMMTSTLQRMDARAVSTPVASQPAPIAKVPSAQAPAAARSISTPLAQAAPTPAPPSLAAPISRPAALMSDIPKAPALPRAAAEEQAPDSRRSAWWSSVPGATPSATPAAPPARTVSSAGMKAASPPPPSASRLPASTSTPASASRVPVASVAKPTPSSAGFPAASASGASGAPLRRANSSAGFPAAPISSRVPIGQTTHPSSSRLPAVTRATPVPQSSRASAVLKALESRRVPAPSDRMPATPHESKLLAEREFQAALQHFKAFRYADANPGFARAAQLLPESAEYRLYAKWNSMMNNGGPVHLHDRGEAWRLALKAVGADPNFAFAHYVAGAVAHEDSKWTIALQYLSRAVKLDPELLDAQRRLRIVKRAEENGETG